MNGVNVDTRVCTTSAHIRFDLCAEPSIILPLLLSSLENVGKCATKDHVSLAECVLPSFKLMLSKRNHMNERQ